jgi:Zn-dependent protease
MSLSNFNIEDVIIEVVVLLISLTVHEYAHGLAAYKLGDATAKMDGRLSLNPLRHIDPIGAIMMIVFQFGWAKPVMINPYNLKNPKQDLAVISFAGPLANFILAAIFTLLLIPCQLFLYNTIAYSVVYSFLYYGLMVNISLAIFNLIPIPPLDGSKVVASILPNKAYRLYMSIDGRITMVIFIVIIWLGVLNRFLSPMVCVVMNGYITVAQWLLQLIA